jgi:hypothetical protein
VVQRAPSCSGARSRLVIESETFATRHLAVCPPCVADGDVHGDDAFHLWPGHRLVDGPWRPAGVERQTEGMSATSRFP